MTSFDPRVRRIAAVGLLAVVLSALWTIVFMPILGLVSASVEALHDRQFELAQLQKRIEQNKRVLTTERVEQLEHVAHQSVVNAASESDAVSAAQAAIESMLRQAGMQMEHMRASTLPEQGFAVRLAIEVRANGKEEALLHALSALDAHNPRMALERISVISKTDAASRNDPVPELMSDMRIVAFWSPQVN